MTDLEDRLRDVLTRVVPEPPEHLALSPAPGRPRRVGAVAGAALLVAAAVLVPVLVARDDGPAPGPGPTTSAAYDAPACPVGTRDLDGQEALDYVRDRYPLGSTPEPATRLPDLTGLTSVRLCPGDGSWLRDPPSAADLAGSVPADALVDGLTAFIATVGALPDADPDLCATVSYLHDGSTLVVTLDDGRSVAVTTSPCEGVGVDRRTVRGVDLLDVFLDALDLQRDRSDYRRDVPPPDCEARPTVAPVDPARDGVVAAVTCPGDDPVAGDALDRLRGAWRTATPQSADLDCLDAGDPDVGVVVTTSRGDTVRLTDYGCGYLTFEDARGGRPWWLQVQVEELT